MHFGGETKAAVWVVSLVSAAAAERVARVSDFESVAPIWRRERQVCLVRDCAGKGDRYLRISTEVAEKNEWTMRVASAFKPFTTDPSSCVAALKDACDNFIMVKEEEKDDIGAD